MQTQPEPAKAAKPLPAFLQLLNLGANVTVRIVNQDDLEVMSLLTAIQLAQSGIADRITLMKHQENYGTQEPGAHISKDSGSWDIEVMYPEEKTAGERQVARLIAAVIIELIVTK